MGLRSQLGGQLRDSRNVRRVLATDRRRDHHVEPLADSRPNSVADPFERILPANGIVPRRVGTIETNLEPQPLGVAPAQLFQTLSGKKKPVAQDDEPCLCRNVANQLEDVGPNEGLSPGEEKLLGPERKGLVDDRLELIDGQPAITVGSRTDQAVGALQVAGVVGMDPHLAELFRLENPAPPFVARRFDNLPCHRVATLQVAKERGGMERRLGRPQARVGSVPTDDVAERFLSVDAAEEIRPPFVGPEPVSPFRIHEERNAIPVGADGRGRVEHVARFDSLAHAVPLLRFPEHRLFPV